MNIDKQFVLKNYSDLFKGLGTFGSDYDIKIKEDAKPIAHPPRRVALALRHKLKLKLDELVKNNVIEKVTGHSEWVNHLVTVQKKDSEKSLRLCLDPSELNLAICDEHAYIPTFEEISSKLNGMMYFTVLDLKDGYWHVKLTKKSTELCHFATPFGTFKFLRLPFGIKTAPSVFQKMNNENFGDIENVVIYFDDILVTGRTKQEHDKALKKVLDRAREKNVRFNINKAQIACREVKYLGHIFSHNQIKPDPERLNAIKEMSRPKNKTDLQTFLGVINIMQSFIPNMSSQTEKLRELLKKNVIYNWTAAHDRAFIDIKNSILNANILVPFDPTKELTIECDASQGGLGCGLLQDKKPISFASRSLTPCEQNYSQIEKEMLSILFACTKFKFYTYGRKVIVVNDHKPLLGIMKKNFHKIASAKLQRMKLKLLNFDIELRYAPGKTINIADYLSRYMIKTDESEEDKSITNAINTINVSDEKRNEFQIETENDEILRQIKDFCKNGWPNNKDNCPIELKYYYKLRDDIMLEDDILFYNEKIIVPTKMRKSILEKLHEPHFGITKTLQRARSSVFWPNITNEIEMTVTRCQVCQRNAPNNRKEPMISHPIPNEPFKKIACDILEQNSKNYLVVIDYYSNWIELIKLKRKTAYEVNMELMKLFSSYGYPHIIVADNMPCGSFECREFAKNHDIEIETSSPRYPQSNGMAERAVQICKNMLKKCNSDEHLFKALLAYRTTPIKNMKYSPAQLLQSRILRTDLPMHINKFKPTLCRNVEKQHKYKQLVTKTYYDKTARKRSDTNFENKQSVLFKNNNKWQAGEIIEKHKTPRSFVIQSENRNYRRNTRHIKPHLESSKSNENKPIDRNTAVHQKVTRSGRTY